MESQVNNEIEAAGLTGDIGFRKGERCISWLSTRHEDTDKKKYTIVDGSTKTYNMYELIFRFPRNRRGALSIAQEMVMSTSCHYRRASIKQTRDQLKFAESLAGLAAAFLHSECKDASVFCDRAAPQLQCLRLT